MMTNVIISEFLFARFVYLGTPQLFYLFLTRART